MSKSKSERVVKSLFLVCAMFSVVCILTICIFLFVKSFPAFVEIGLFKFLFGTKWFPNEGMYGILPMIVNSIYVTAFAIFFGIAIGVMGAIFLAKFCPKKLFAPIRQMINVLAGIPSVIYGFFGLQFIIPLFSNLAPSGNGFGLLASGLVLGIMVLPTVASLSLNSIMNVPANYYEGAVALGATHEQATFKVVVPAAKSGIMAGVVLGITRAIGETMAVVMVAGNVPYIADSLFGGLLTMTGNIVLEMSYATGLHQNALFATATVLFVFVLIITISFNVLSNRKRNLSKSKFRRLRASDDSEVTSYQYRLKRTASNIMKWLTVIAIIFAVSFLLFIIGYVLFRGIPHLNFSILFGQFSWDGPTTMLPALVTTLMLIGFTLLFALVIGIASAIFLVEFTKRGSRLVKIIRVGLETLSGIPSIVFGLFGMLFFGWTLGMGYSIMAGALTLTIMILPTVVRTTEEALKEVPDSYREASLALGASKTRTIFKVVLPNAVSGIFTSIILSTGRIIGESAAVLFTVGTMQSMPTGPMSSGISLSVLIYVLSKENLHVNEAFAVAVVLLILVVSLNLLSSLIESKAKSRKIKVQSAKKVEEKENVIRCLVEAEKNV